MRQTHQKIRQLAEKYSRNIGSLQLYRDMLAVAFEAGYLAAVEHEKNPEDKLPLPKCFVCQEGVLKPTGSVKMSNPPFYEFKCDRCDMHQDISQKKYLEIDPKLIHNSKELSHGKFKQDTRFRE